MMTDAAFAEARRYPLAAFSHNGVKPELGVKNYGYEKRIERIKTTTRRNRSVIWSFARCG